MMTKAVIRPADHNDVEALAQIKGVYVRDLYRGFLPADILKQRDDGSFVPEMERWLEQRDFRVDVMESLGGIRGFIIYGADPEAEGCGLIREMTCALQCDENEKRALVERALRQLVSMGLSEVHMWILRDNFRTRFLFESMGFRADGERKTQLMKDWELTLNRYCYQVLKTHGWQPPARGEADTLNRDKP